MDIYTIGSILAAAVSSSFGTALVVHWMTTRREDLARDREVAYLALRLASKLENYAQEAATFVGNIGAFTAGMAQGVCTDLPVFSDLPSEQERWRDLNVHLTNEVLSFDGERKSQQDRIEDVATEGMEEAIDLSQDLGIVLAVRALHLAGLLRKHHQLPHYDTESPWVEFVMDRYDALPDVRKVRLPVIPDSKRLRSPLRTFRLSHRKND